MEQELSPLSRAGGVDAEDRLSRWSGAAMAAALDTAAALFAPHVPEINALNVFPVPDGDTGSNMHLTLRSAAAAAVRAARDGVPSAGQVLAATAHGALMGARGNSGVILYQILAGLAQAARDRGELDGPGLAAGLQRAAELAYRAVVAPVEGTMLTVIGAAARAAAAADNVEGASIEPVLAAALSGADEALRQTPAMLPILREAGVVDAGGQGLVRWLEGLLAFARGATAEAATVSDARVESVATEMGFLDLPQVVHGAEEYGYCTNFVVTGTDLPVDEFRGGLGRLGTSAVAVGDTETLKVHVHSEHPGEILELALRYGELHDVRIDNMSAQTRRLLAERADAMADPGHRRLAQPLTAIGVVAVAGGAGLTAVFRGMGADAVVPAGQTFNPSTSDIAGAVESISHAEVIVLPNDPNVIPTARQVEQLTDRAVRVVPSRSIPQGISALAAFNYEASLHENVAAMTRALDLVRSLALARATRTAEIGGVRAVAGEFVGFVDGGLRAAGSDAVAVVLDLLRVADAERAELVTLFVGQPAAPDLAERVQLAVAEGYPDLTVEVVGGGQPHYDLIVSVE